MSLNPFFYYWSHRADLNRWPAGYESAALPPELRWLLFEISTGWYQYPKTDSSICNNSSCYHPNFRYYYPA